MFVTLLVSQTSGELKAYACSSRAIVVTELVSHTSGWLKNPGELERLLHVTLLVSQPALERPYMSVTSQGLKASAPWNVLTIVETLLVSQTSSQS